MKILSEQLDDYGQTLKMEIILSNGKPLDLNNYVRALVKTQSLKAWQGDDVGFKNWIASQVTTHIQSAEIKISNHGKNSVAA